MSNPLPNPDPFEFFRRLWSPVGSAIPGFAPNMMFPTANVSEIDKRISDLRSVESWLALNLETVKAMIQGLEAQKATINAFRSMNAAAASAATSAATVATSAAADVARARRSRKKKDTPSSDL